VTEAPHRSLSLALAGGPNAGPSAGPRRAVELVLIFGAVFVPLPLIGVGIGSLFTPAAAFVVGGVRPSSPARHAG
jgi:hypothetical protein